MTYSSNFLDNFYDTRHVGSLSGDDVYHMQHDAKQPFSSAELYIRVQNNKVAMARFHASTTPTLIATAEYVCRWIEGKSLDECGALTVKDVLAALDLTTMHSHVVRVVVRLLLDVIKQAT